MEMMSLWWNLKIVLSGQPKFASFDRGMNLEVTTKAIRNKENENSRKEADYARFKRCRRSVFDKELNDKRLKLEYDGDDSLDSEIVNHGGLRIEGERVVFKLF